MVFDSQRQFFEIPPDIIYLNCAYIGLPPKSVIEAGRKALNFTSQPWNLLPKHFYEQSDALRVEFSNLIKSTPERVSLIPSVSYGMSFAARNIKFNPGDEILVLENQFPSNVYPWSHQADKSGAVVTIVPRPENSDWTTAIAASINHKTRLLALPHCLWTDGSYVDLVTISDICRKKGLYLVVDASQAIGAMPFNWEKVQPDLLVTVGYKWLMGPYSLAVMVVGDRLMNAEPLEQTWLSRQGSENFQRLVEYRNDLVDTAARFDMGERSNFVAVPMLLESLKYIKNLGIENIYEHCGDLTDLLEQGVLDKGYQTIERNFRSSHLLGIKNSNGIDPELPERLKNSGVFVSHRGDSIRVSPNVYSNRNDIKSLISHL